MASCTNCEEEIKEGEEIQDDEGNYFCSQEHLDKWHKDEDGDADIDALQQQEEEENKAKFESEQAAKADEAYDEALAEAEQEDI